GAPAAGHAVPTPRVAPAGRPNVGKSSLFTALPGRPPAIADPTAGVPRDRVTTLVQAGDRYLELVDTGGLGIRDVDDLTADIERQIRTALDQAAVVLFVVDARAGVMPPDEDVAGRLRQIHKPVVCVANKADTPALDEQTGEFFNLGFGPPLCVSALQNRGQRELLRRVLDLLPPTDGDGPVQDVALKLAIVGRRNTGKSTFINSVAESERMIVS